jgi:hypothetical protein
MPYQIVNKYFVYYLEFEGLIEQTKNKVFDNFVMPLLC